jgi:PadR family transcriptional regulator AphA
MAADKTTTVECLLGLLSLGPMTGYEMRHTMERSTAKFWSESFGQIYPALKSMVKDGLVTVEEKTGGGRAKKIYKLTAAGERRLRQWLQIEAKPVVHRHELLLKIFFGDQAERGAIASQVVAERDRREEDLQGYEAALVWMETAFARHPAMPYWKMTVRYGISEAKAVIAWCDETFAELEKRGLVSRV